MIIGIIGVPGSGKTSLARYLAAKMRTHPEQRFRDVELVFEYARDYIKECGQTECLWEQHLIINNQLKLELELKDNVSYLITDSPILLGMVYGEELVHRQSPKDVFLMNELFTLVNKHASIYDLMVCMGLGYTPDDDGVRNSKYFRTDWRERTQTRILNWVKFFKLPYLSVDGLTVTEAAEKILSALKDSPQRS
jgi:nicotinamide riboside kinase